MGYFNPISYFIKSFLRIFSKKFFWVILIAICLFLAFCLFGNSGVFAESLYSTTDIYTSSNLSTAQSKVGNSIWNDDSYDIFLFNCPYWGNRTNLSWQKGVVYWKVDTNLARCKYYLNTGNPGEVLNPSNIYYDICLVNLDNSDVGISGIYQKSLERSPSVTELGGATRTNLTDVGWYNNYSVNLTRFTAVYSNPYQIYLRPIRSHYDVCDGNGNVIVSATNPIPVAPYFITTDTELQTFDFDYLQINGGTTKYHLENNMDALLRLDYYYKGVQYTFNLDNYITVNADNTWQINIPYNALTNNIIIRDGEAFEYTFIYFGENGEHYTINKSLTYDLTTEEESQINEDSQKSLESAILNSNQQTANSIQNMENTINDSNVDDITNDTLPSDNTTDITADGVNGIFTSIYNAFCTGNAQDIVFPIPFTNKNFTLPANYISSMLTNANASFVITLIQAFWWYLISRFIVKDIMDKINKIKSGDIEKIETENIRGDML